MLKKIYNILEITEDKNKLAKIIDWLLISLIVLNVVSVIVSSFNNLSATAEKILNGFEIVSVIIFTIEYVLRLMTSKYKYENSRFPYFRYMFSFLAIIDLFAILPFYLPLIIPFDLRFLRMLRLFRLFRIFKLNYCLNYTLK